MKKLLLVASFFLLTFSAGAQQAQNLADLDFLYQAIQRLPSYKDQLKNDKAYHQLYDSLRKDIGADDEFVAYQKLLQLVYPLKDNHLSLYRKPDSAFRFNYLRPALDAAAVEAKFSTYPADSLEGIYNSPGGTDKLVLYKQAARVFYLQNLRTGVVEVILNQTVGKTMDAIRFMNPPVPYALYRNIRLSNGMLTGLYYRKNGLKKYAPYPTAEGNYAYEELEQGIGYLRLGSFNSSNENIKVATDFFTRIKAGIATQQLIVDLRNNGGGGYKTSGQFAAFLKRYKGKIFLLQNSNTMSNAEQFIINLKDSKNLTTLGEATRGTITYGSNYGKTITLPSNRFVFFPTDMSGRPKDLVFESKGIEPDVALDAFGDDWMIQTLKYIHSQQL